MNRPFRRVRFLVSLTLLCCLAGVGASSVRADGPVLTAVFGIAGRYRPGAWCPVTVTVRNPSSGSLAGQIQALAGADANRNGPSGNRILGAALFARPVTVSVGAGPQSFLLYTRGLDPGRDSVTVQLVEGRQRGDGRALAQANTQDTKTSQAISGTPIGDSDLLLVGFGGDPGAFIPLNGRQLGLTHQAGGSGMGNGSRTMPNMTVVSQPSTVQVAEAAGTDLPDKAAGYGGVDAFLLRSDAPLDALTEAQTDALRGWVAGGGHLVVCGGVDPSRFAPAFYSGLLPAAIGAARPALSLPGIGPVGALTLAPKPLPGVRVLVSAPDGSPLVVAGPYGAGCVTLAAYDPTSKAFQSPTFNSGALWRTLLTGGPSASAAVLPYVAAREENYHPNYFYGADTQLLSDAVMRGPSLDAPGTEVIGLFLLIYLVALVPANYLILKRLDRKELAWVTIPLLVLLFAVGTFGVGYAAKGGSVFVNRAAIVETTAGRHEAGVYAEMGLFSPHRTSYDLSLSGENALAAIPNPGVSYGYRSSANADTQTYGLTKFVQTPDGGSLLDTSVNMWAMRAFDVQATEDLGGTVDSTLAGQGDALLSRVAGTVTNHLSHTLTGCVLFHNGQWQTLGDLPPGASLPVSNTSPDGPGSAGSLSGLPFSSPANRNDARSDIHVRMRAALADFARSLGQQSSNGNQAQSATAYLPSPGEALLLGWSDDPALAGPDPRVDGHTVHENTISLVVVHLPIKGARIVAATPPQPAPSQAAGMTSGYRLPPQQQIALPSARFTAISRTSILYKQTMEAHNLTLAQRSLGRTVRFRGTITQVTQDAQSQRLTLAFDPQHTRALTAVLTFGGYSRLPNMQWLQGKEVVVSGPLLRYGDKMAVMLTQPTQIQVVR